MGDITENFSYSEYACHCECGCSFINIEHVKCNQRFRDYLWKVTGEEWMLIPKSGCRCPEYNNTPISKGGVGSKPTSQHTFKILAKNLKTIEIAKDGRPCATDFKAESVRTGKTMDPKVLAQHALEFGEYTGIGLYSWGVHVDNRRGPKARWGF